ncbi:MAG: phospholipase [Nitrospira sp.]|nr:phospholipase [Nitrospira sp.]
MTDLRCETAFSGREKRATEQAKPVPKALLVPGRNCWRLEAVEKAAFLIDGEAYFRAFRDVALQATQSIMIVGWDLDTRTELVRDPGAGSNFPTRLGEFLIALLRRKRKLRVYVLNWDFAMIYAWEREWLPTAQPGWRHHCFCGRAGPHEIQMGYAGACFPGCAAGGCRREPLRSLP